MVAFIERLNGALSESVDAAARTLVQVKGRRGGGAGIVWRSEGVVVTNAHVVGRRPPEVTLCDGRRIAARVVARDVEADLAVLAVEAEGLTAAVPGDALSLRPGELVFAHGHPWGVEGAVTSGVVVGTGSYLPGAQVPQDGREWLVVNMRLRPGNSGGPVFDAQGRVVGISTVMAGPEIGLAVPSHVVARFVEEALA